MISRRRFLGASSLAVAGTAAGCQVPQSSGEGSSPEGSGSARDLPPSIAALTSQAHRSTPISVEERAGRIEKARRLMVDTGMNALMLTGGTSLLYFTDIRWGLSERMLSVVIPTQGQAFLVCPAFEEERAREQLHGGPLADTEVLTWHEHESPYSLVAQGLRDRGLGTGRMGIEETVRFVFSDGVAREAPALTLTSGTPVTAGCRGVKDEHELALMQLANEVTLTAYSRDGRTATTSVRLIDGGGAPRIAIVEPVDGSLYTNSVVLTGAVSPRGSAPLSETLARAQWRIDEGEWRDLPLDSSGGFSVPIDLSESQGPRTLTVRAVSTTDSISLMSD